MSMPPWVKATEAAVRFPAKLSVRVTARPDWRGVEGLYGVMQRMKGWMASRALKREAGIEKGSAWRKGTKTDGVEL